LFVVARHLITPEKRRYQSVGCSEQIVGQPEAIDMSD